MPVFASVGAGLDSAIEAQEAIYQACLAAGHSDCRLNFDPAAALTPQLIGALVALGVLSLAPVVVKRIAAHRAAGRGCPLPHPPPQAGEGREEG